MVPHPSATAGGFLLKAAHSGAGQLIPHGSPDTLCIQAKSVLASPETLGPSALRLSQKGWLDV